MASLPILASPPVAAANADPLDNDNDDNNNNDNNNNDDDDDDDGYLTIAISSPGNS
jgi:hypothetical protein